MRAARLAERRAGGDADLEARAFVVVLLGRVVAARHDSRVRAFALLRQVVEVDQPVVCAPRREAEHDGLVNCVAIDESAHRLCDEAGQQQLAELLDAAAARALRRPLQSTAEAVVAPRVLRKVPLVRRRRPVGVDVEVVDPGRRRDEAQGEHG